MSTLNTSQKKEIIIGVIISPLVFLSILLGFLGKNMYKFADKTDTKAENIAVYLIKKLNYKPD